MFNSGESLLLGSKVIHVFACDVFDVSCVPAGKSPGAESLLTKSSTSSSSSSIASPGSSSESGDEIAAENIGNIAQTTSTRKHLSPRVTTAGNCSLPLDGHADDGHPLLSAQNGIAEGVQMHDAAVRKNLRRSSHQVRSQRVRCFISAVVV